MTREEIEELKGLAASMGLYDDKNPCKRAVILGKAIQELEQEPVLDKIRAEIKALTSNRGFLSCSINSIHKEIDAVFDKYKSESEE